MNEKGYVRMTCDRVVRESDKNVLSTERSMCVEDTYKVFFGREVR